MQKEIRNHLAELKANVYPGRGIVVGLSPDGAHFVQVYWIMGRSANSRNRVFVAENNVVRTAPFDASKVEDPSLIIYNCVRVQGRVHIVTNGDQTDTIADILRMGSTFEDALATRTFEPDAPNFTPRSSAVVNLDDKRHAYQIGIIKTIHNDPGLAVRCIYNYGTALPGVGHFISTYRGDGTPLPSFAGEPQVVEIPAGIDATRDLYWDLLDADNRVSLLVRWIERTTGVAQTRVVNKHAP